VNDKSSITETEGVNVTPSLRVVIKLSVREDVTVRLTPAVWDALKLSTREMDGEKVGADDNVVERSSDTERV